MRCDEAGAKAPAFLFEPSIHAGGARALRNRCDRFVRRRLASAHRKRERDKASPNRDWAIRACHSCSNRYTAGPRVAFFAPASSWDALNQSGTKRVRITTADSRLRDHHCEVNATVAEPRTLAMVNRNLGLRFAMRFETAPEKQGRNATSPNRQSQIGSDDSLTID